MKTSNTKQLVETIEPAYLKFIFFGLSVVILACMMFVATRVGVTGDEYLDGLNGKYALNYFADGDTTFANYANVPEINGMVHLKYYGTGFEIWPSFFVRYLNLPETQIYLFRHLLCALFGFLLIMFTALIAKKLAGYKAAIFAMLLMACSPTVFGLSFFATKDIPFAAGFAIAIYAYISIFETLPKFKVWHIILAICGIALAVSIRIGGLMLPFYLLVAFLCYIVVVPDVRRLLFTKPYTLLYKSLAIGIGIVVLGMFWGFCFYPNFFYEGMVGHIKNALNLVSAFPQRIPMLFERKMIDSLNLPENYLLKSFLYTIPLFVFGAWLLVLVNCRKMWRNYDRGALLFLLISAIFPLVIIFVSNSNVYNGWRHETFIYCGAIVLAAIALAETTNWFNTMKFHKIWGILAPALIVVSMIPTVVWMVKNYKYTYSYYNAIVGDPYMKFDMDYYETAQTVCLDWLVKNCLDGDSVSVSVKNNNAIDYAEKRKYDNIHLTMAAYWIYSDLDVDYSILSTHFMEKKFLKNFFPPKGTVHVETIYGHPVAAVVKRNKLDVNGIKMAYGGKLKEGVQMLDSAYRYDPNNFGVWYPLGYSLYRLEENERAIPFLDKAISFDLQEDETAYATMYAAICTYNIGKYEDALTRLEKAEEVCIDKSKMELIHAYYGKTYKALGDYKNAIKHLNMAIAKYPILASDLEACKKEVSKVQH